MKVFDLDMIKAAYARMPERVDRAKKLIGRPLTLAENILYSNLWNTQTKKPKSISKDYICFSANTSIKNKLRFSYNNFEESAYNQIFKGNILDYKSKLNINQYRELSTHSNNSFPILGVEIKKLRHLKVNTKGLEIATEKILEDYLFYCLDINIQTPFENLNEYFINKVLRFSSKIKNILTKSVGIYTSKLFYKSVYISIENIISPKLFFNYVDDTDANRLTISV